jgi:hypothetical protein
VAELTRIVGNRGRRRDAEPVLAELCPRACARARIWLRAEPPSPPLHRVHRPASRENPAVPQGHPGQPDGSQDRASDLFAIHRHSPVSGGARIARTNALRAMRVDFIRECPIVNTPRVGAQPPDRSSLLLRRHGLRPRLFTACRKSGRPGRHQKLSGPRAPAKA